MSKSTATTTALSELSADTLCLALRPREAAKALGLGVRKLWELTNRGLIPHIKVDRCVLYPTDALRRWLDEQVGKDKSAGNGYARRSRPGAGYGDPNCAATF